MNSEKNRESNQDVRTHFDRLVDDYSSNFSGRRSGKYYNFCARLNIVNSLMSKESGSFLDCACGPGQISSSAVSAGNFNYVHLVDLSGKMLDKARGELCCDQPNKGIDFTVGDIFDIADRDGEKYDCILCLGLIAHTGRLQELLTLLARILTPSGKIVLQSSNADHLGILITRLLTKKWYLRRQGYKISYYSQSDIESAAHESGFQINSVTKYCVGIPILDRVLPKFNFWIENRFGDFAAKNGAEMILVLEKKALGSTS